MDVLSNLNKNIFGENHKHASDSINFSAQAPPVKKNQKIFEPKSNKTSKEEKEQKEQKETKIITNNNNLGEIKKEKPKVKENSDDPLSYNYNKKDLRNITDPLSQMRPNSTFGYPTKKKETKDNKNNEKKEKEKKDQNKNKENKESKENKDNTGTQKSREAVMTGLFGDYSNININKNKIGNNINPLQMNQTPLNNNINPVIMMNYMNLINMQNSLNQ